MFKADFDKVNALFLSYPKGFSNEYESLVPFYDQLIRAVPGYIKLYLIVNHKKVKEEVQAKFSRKNLSVIVVEYWDEIWLRDCMGIPGNDVVCKPKYFPNYCVLNKYRSYYNFLNRLTKEIIQGALGYKILDLPINLDCGNFVHNGKIAFITNKVIEDNPGKEVKKIIKGCTGLTPIIIDKNYYDVVGHSDGYLAFKDFETIYISNYPELPFLVKDNEYVNNLKSVAEMSDIKTLPIYDRPVDEPVKCGCKNIKTRSCYYSARGIYVNFIRLNNTIIMPEYTLPINCSIDYNALNKQVLSNQGFEVVTINCDSLARLGGSLHCLSFQV